MSDEDANVLLDGALEKQGDNDPTGMSWLGMEVTRDFYESKIASGELRVVVKVGLFRPDLGDAMRYCEACGHFGMDDDLKPFNFCPGCGSSIQYNRPGTTPR